MKSAIIFVYLILISILSFSQAPPIESDPHRGLYINGFIKITNGIINEDNSILGVDQDRDGVYEKEDSLLRYLQRNHITYMLLYDLRKMFGYNHTAYDALLASYTPLQDHLCRFMQKARLQYCVTEIGAVVGSDAEINNVVNFNSLFETPTPSFLFSPIERLSSQFNLLSAADTIYSVTDSLFVESEMLKFLLRVSHFGGMTNECSEHFDYIHIASEWWNESDKCAAEQAVANIAIHARAVADLWNSQHPNELMYTEGYFLNAPTVTCTGYTLSPLSMAGTYDGSNFYPPFYRLLDRICPAYYFRNFTIPTGSMSSTYTPTGFTGIASAFASNTNFPQTDLHPIFNTESRDIDGGYDSYVGPYLRQSHEHNMFLAERECYDRWRDWQGGGGYNDNVRTSYGTDPFQNNIQPGGLLWYAYRHSRRYDFPVLFTSNSPVCTGTPLSFNYIGPIEKGILYEFEILLGAITQYQSSGISTDYSPEFVNVPTQQRVMNIILPSVSNLPPNDYTARLTLHYNGLNGCSYFYDLPIQVSSSASIVAHGNTTFCDGDNVTISAISGATSYSWWNGTTQLNRTNDTLIVKESGDYYCVITGGNCAGSSSHIPVNVLSNPPLHVNILCDQGSGYTLTVNPFHGSSPAGVTYLWETGSTADNITVTSHSRKSYYVTATSSDGCISMSKATIQDPMAEYNLTINSTSLPSDLNCLTANQRLTATITAVTPSDAATSPANYLWSDWSINRSIDYLLPGSYCVAAAIGTSGCFQSWPCVTVSGNTFTPVITNTISNVTCFGGHNGSISISNITGGSGTYNLVWQSISASNISNNGYTVSNLTAGTYQLTIEDNTNCAIAQVDFTITQAGRILVSLEANPLSVNCHGNSYNSIALNHVSGGTSPFNYQWSNLSQSTTQNLIGPLSPGSYTVVITDYNNCTTSSLIDLAQPLEITFHETQQDECGSSANGFIHVSVSNGVRPFGVNSGWTYNINSQLYERNNISAGSYTFTLRDASGCTASASYAITSNIFPSFTVNSLTICNGSQAILTASNNSLNYIWSDANQTTQSITVQPNITTIYTVIGSDIDGCSATATGLVTVNQVPTIANAGSDQNICISTSSSTINLSGNSPSIGIANWTSSSGGTFGNSSLNSSTFTGQVGNSYNITWAISNSPCPSSTDDVIITFAPSTFSNAGTNQNVCGNIAALNANNPAIGTGLWSSNNGGIFSNATSPVATFTGVQGNVYTLTWTVTNGFCSTASSIQVNMRILPTVSILNNPICIGGQLCASPSTYPSYSWNTNENTNCITPTSAGTYSVVTTATNGCTTTSSTTLQNCCSIYLSTKFQQDFNLPFTNYNNLSFNLGASIVLNSNFTISNCNIAIPPGVSITVPSGITLNIVNHSVLYACGDMWAGIIVEEGGTLIVDESTIADAENGVFIQKNSTNLSSSISISTSEFRSNYIGVFIEPNSNQVMNNVSLTIYNSQFNTTYPLKHSLNYSVGDKTYAGIYLNDWTGTIGKYGSLGNNFYNLNIGIRSNRCILTVVTSFFNNIFPDNSYGSIPFYGSGIYAEGQDGSYFLNQHGPGKNSVPSFVNCYYGIYTNGVRVNINTNRMTEMYNGILVQLLPNGSNSYVLNNHIGCNLSGIVTEFNDDIKLFTIAGNTVDVDNATGDYNNYGLGIGTYDFSLPRNINIWYNTVNMKNGRVGIDCVGARANLIVQNQINFKYATSNAIAGFNSWGSNRNMISCNNVFGNTGNSSDDQYGYYFGISQSNDVSCNNSTEINYGFEFDGVCNMFDQLTGNYMTNNWMGLRLSSTGEISDQIHRGNVWFNSGSAFSSGIAAEKLSNSLENIYADQINLDFNPSNISPPNWFIPNPGDEYNCRNEENCTSKDVDNRGIGSTEQVIAADQLNPAEFSDETKWMSRMYLFQKMAAAPSEQYDSLLQSFYNQYLNSNIGKQAEIKRSIEDVETANNVITQMLSNNDSLLSYYQLSLDSINKLFDEGLINNSQFDITRRSIKGIISSLIEDSKNLVSEFFARKDSSLLLTNILNQAILSTAVFEENEKSINDLYMRTIAKRIITFNVNDSLNLVNIAMQCPFSGGPSVYLARSIYRLIDPYKNYEDYPICHSIGLLRQRRQGTNFKIISTAYPNPADQFVNIQLDVGQSEIHSLKIYDSSLKLIVQDTFESNLTQKKISIGDFMPGLYIYVIINKNAVLSSGKFAIQR